MKELWEAVWTDERFQAACQRYANGNGSSEAIAKAALAAAETYKDLKEPQ